MILPSYTTFRALFAPGAPPDVAGWETWPLSSVFYPPGEPGFNLTLPTDLSPFTLAISVNSPGPGLVGDDDPVAGVDLFDWYVSQRSDSQAGPFKVYAWHDYPSDFVAGNTKSGTIILELRPSYYFATSGFVIPPDNLAAVYRDVFVYVRRRSNGHIMWGNLLEHVEGLA